MAFDCITNSCLADTGFNYTMSLIQGKYKMVILYTLMEFKVVRFNEMKKYIGGISYKTLSSTLKELESDKLVHREEYPQIPPKVEFWMHNLIISYSWYFFGFFIGSAIANNRDCAPFYIAH